MSKEKKSLILDILVILLLGLLSITWFRGNNLIGGGDFGMPLDWIKYFKSLFFVWNESYSMGGADYRQAASLIPYALLGALLQKLGFSLVLIEKIFFYVWFAGSGVSMYYLTWILGMKRLGRLAASIFYMLNPFSLIIIWRVSHGLIQMPYAFAPLVLGLYVRGVREFGGFRDFRVLRHIILANFVWLLTTASAYANPRMVVVHWFPILGYFFLVFVLEPRRRRFAWKYTLVFLGIWGLFNFYWLLPLITSLRESVASAHLPFLIPDIEEVELTSVKFLEAVRMLGYWSTKSGYKGDPYYSFWQFYVSGLGNWLAWLIPILVSLGIWGNKGKDRTLGWFLVSLVVFGLVGINGAYPPLGKLFLWLCGLFPPLALLTRFNFLFFGMPTYLGFSILVGYGALVTYEWGEKKFGSSVWGLLGVLGVLLGVVLVLPFWSGEVIQAEGKIFPSERFQVPDYWFEAKNWLTNQKDFFRILPFPMSKTYNVAFDWEKGYSGGDPTRWFTSQPVLNVNTGKTFDIPMLIGESVERQSKVRSFDKLLGFLDVKYLMLRNDSRWDFLRGHGWWFYHQPENIQNFIKNQNNLKLEKEIGQLKLYRVADNYLLPRIYIPRVITFIDGEVASLEDLAQFLKPEEKEAFVLGQEGDYIWRRPTIPEKDGKSDFTKAVYEIQVRKRGRYEVLLRDDDFLRFYQGEGDRLKIEVDQGEIREKDFVSRGDNLISFGEIELEKGNHLITVFLPPAVNLTGYSLGNQSFKATAVQDEKIASFPIRDFKPGETYGISLDAKNVQGNRPLLLFWENYIDSTEPVFNQRLGPFDRGTQKTTFSKIELPVGTTWRNYSFTFKPNHYAESIGLSLVSSPDYLGNVVFNKTENLFANLKVQQVFTNPMVLRRVDENDREAGGLPGVNFRKISPVRYEVEVNQAKGPFWLVFSEAFHPGWKTSVGADHLMVNGFANGWYIKKLGDYQFNIFFEPQNYLNVGVMISGLTILFFVLYLGIARIKVR